MNLGELIALMKTQSMTAWVYIDGPVRLTPGDLDSYRGYYEDLAIGVNADGIAPTVADFIAMLQAADGKTFTGYKGGEYRMTLKTRVWFSNRGESSDYGPSGIKDSGTHVVTLGYASLE